ncbi:MAG: hypothetical protein LBD98_00870 [Endomicrobium sp.]|nr:hypothetical protein [Endomicrobium sp.]
MKKILALTIFVGVCCVSFGTSSSIATDREGKEGVFFCTRDIENSGSKRVPSDKSVKDHESTFIVVNSKDTFWHSHLRHCFLVWAKKIAETSMTFTLRIIASAGVLRTPSDKIQIVEESSWLFDKEKRKESRISCTPIIQEGMPVIITNDDPYNNTSRLCTGRHGFYYDCKVFDNCFNGGPSGTCHISKICARMSNNNEGCLLNTEYNFIISKDDVYEFWVRSHSAMVTLGIAANYSVSTNNCCTVVFKSLRQVIEEENKFNLSLSHIKKRNFNFLGRGVPFAFDADDSFYDITKGVARTFFDTTASLPKTGISIINNIYNSNFGE